jgi:LysR family glycine cleavage system transcriptional activator
MARRLPPLNALRAFEAAARHGSFAKAAQELSVTSGAVSAQVKLLEEILGIRLFARSKHSVEITALAGQAVPHLTEAFDRMARAVEALGEAGRRTHLRVGAPLSFAAKWLSPRLARRPQPAGDVEIVPLDGPEERSAGALDCVVLRSAEPPAGLPAERLGEDGWLPVCSAALLAELGGRIEPRDLRRLPLIHDVETAAGGSATPWEEWLAARRVEGVDGRRGLRFGRSCMAVDAALEGRGIALTRSAVAADLVETGALACPLGRAEAPTLTYWAVFPAPGLQAVPVRALARWLLPEARGSLAAALSGGAGERPGARLPGQAANGPRR